MSFGAATRSKFSSRAGSRFRARRNAVPAASLRETRGVETPENEYPASVSAEWIRAISFMVAAAGLLIMGFVHQRNDTGWWMAGLAIALLGVAGFLVAASMIEPARAVFESLVKLRSIRAFESLVELNRIPPFPAPHRTPRILAAMFGLLSGAAGVLVIARLLTL